MPNLNFNKNSEFLTDVDILEINSLKRRILLIALTIVAESSSNKIISWSINIEEINKKSVIDCQIYYIENLDHTSLYNTVHTYSKHKMYVN